MIELSRLRETALVREPFEHVIVPGFIDSEARDDITADFPRIRKGGSFPLEGLARGPAFDALVHELERPGLRSAVEEKFALDLSRRPTMVTVRGRARAKDGRIHTDSRSKILTALIYLNPQWSEAGGRLRLLRCSSSLEDYAAEVSPEFGTAVFFRCTPNAWHGHTPFAGKRRVLQLNWVRDESVVWRENRRHRFSAWLKARLAG